MKILKFQFIVLILFLSTTIFAQSLDCPSNLKMRHPSPPFGFNDLSKSAQCLTGKKYEFLLPLTKGKDYRISFFASPVFNNNIQFRIIDVNSGKKVFDLPGESEANNKGECVLKAYFDNKLNKLVHPYFDFFPASSTQLKIIIEVASIKQENSDSNFKAPEVRNKGCITVFVQDKKADKIGF